MYYISYAYIITYMTLIPLSLCSVLELKWSSRRKQTRRRRRRRINRRMRKRERGREKRRRKMCISLRDNTS